MIFISIITIIAAKALPLFKKISSIHISRIASIIFIYTGAISLNCFDIQSIGSGIGIYSGLFHITPISQLMEIFLFFIGGCILIGWPHVLQKYIYRDIEIFFILGFFIIIVGLYLLTTEVLFVVFNGYNLENLFNSNLDLWDSFGYNLEKIFNSKFDFWDSFGITMGNFFILNSLLDFWDSFGINMENFFILNSLLNSNTGLSFSGFLKIIFIIFFVLLHIGLLYVEYLESHSKNKDAPHYSMESCNSPALQRAASHFSAGAAAYATYITLKFEYPSSKRAQAKEAEYRKSLAEAKNETKKINNAAIIEKMYHKLQFEHIERSQTTVDNLRKKKSDLLRLIAEREAKFSEGVEGVSQFDHWVSMQRTIVQAIELLEKIAANDLKQAIASGHRYSKEICKETICLALVKAEDVKKTKNKKQKQKSMMIHLDRLWTKFDSLNGISKLVCLMILTSSFILWCIIWLYINYVWELSIMKMTSSFILWCIFGILINRYGKYIVSRFKLEEKYPKIAKIITYRKKLSRYYIVTIFLISYLFN
jgi:hypothetical protein